ncbi:MAG: hypothetical protein MJK11_17325, partial [Pseudomonadales bacterium]|nr:hypothetical protein [Pseudomonadales bacterium]
LKILSIKHQNSSLNTLNYSLFFETQIWPTIINTCETCHNQNGSLNITYNYDPESIQSSFFTTTLI